MDLSHAFDEIADDAGRQADLGPVEGIVRRRRRRRTVRHTVVGAGALAVVGGLAFAGTSLAAWRAPEPQPAITGPAPTPTPDVSPAPDGALPLKDPYVPRWDGTAAISSDMPGPGYEGEDAVLEDGDYVVGVLDVDPEARVLHVSINGFSGDADGSGVVDEALRPHTLPVAPDAVVTGFCQDADGTLTQRALTLETLQEAPGPGCDGPDPDAVERDVFWADVRGGLVRQIVGQGWPRTTGTEVTPPPSTMPLADPWVSRWTGQTTVSDSTGPEEMLPDGDYYADVTAVDPAARTITVDILTFYGGDAADEYLRVHEPERYAETGGALNDYALSNQSDRLRTLHLADDAIITGACWDGEISQRARVLDDLTEITTVDCPDWLSYAGGDPRPQGFWVDVRGGAVAQLVGQYLP